MWNLTKSDAENQTLTHHYHKASPQDSLIPEITTYYSPIGWKIKFIFNIDQIEQRTRLSEEHKIIADELRQTAINITNGISDHLFYRNDNIYYLSRTHVHFKAYLNKMLLLASSYEDFPIDFEQKLKAQAVWNSIRSYTESNGSWQINYWFMLDETPRTDQRSTANTVPLISQINIFWCTPANLAVTFTINSSNRKPELDLDALNLFKNDEMNSLFYPLTENTYLLSREHPKFSEYLQSILNLAAEEKFPKELADEVKIRALQIQPDTTLTHFIYTETKPLLDLREIGSNCKQFTFENLPTHHQTNEIAYFHRILFIIRQLDLPLSSLTIANLTLPTQQKQAAFDGAIDAAAFQHIIFTSLCKLISSQLKLATLNLNNIKFSSFSLETLTIFMRALRDLQLDTLSLSANHLKQMPRETWNFFLKELRCLRIKSVERHVNPLTAFRATQFRKAAALCKKNFEEIPHPRKARWPFNVTRNTSTLFKRRKVTAKTTPSAATGNIKGYNLRNRRNVSS